MFQIVFYRTKTGESDIEYLLETLLVHAATNKDARIQHKQIAQYIQFLQDYGTRLGENVTKHLEDEIWELRPGNNRILFFFFKDDTYVLLHHFRKKTQKTPKKEIERAKAEMLDWIERNAELHE